MLVNEINFALLSAAEIQEILDQNNFSCIDDGTLVASDAQRIEEYQNLSVNIYQLGDKLIMQEDMCAASNWYLIDNAHVEFVMENLNAFINYVESECASNEDDERLARCRWELETPVDYAAPEDYTGAVCIIAEYQYNGYWPIDYVRDEQSRIMEFGTVAAAQEWIGEQESTTYYLDHDERERPDYTIWPLN